MSEFLKESLFLDDIIQKMNQKKISLKEKQEFYKKMLVHDYDLYSFLIYQAKYDENKILKNENSPYFAHLIFANSLDDKDESIYIGKNSFSFNDKHLITDWRAPISTLYYDENLGEVEYQALEERHKGILKLKRQIVIENQKLVSINDIDVMAQDELLKPYLNADSEIKLKNIISTIQKQQNEIIRKPLYTNLVVQGVAGSGKTTVALHKLAFLIYNYKNKFQAEDFLIIGPNKLFLEYITATLPDIDAENIKQLTYTDFSCNFIGEDFTLKPENNNVKDDYLCFKASLHFTNLLEDFIEEFMLSLLPADGINFKEITIFNFNYLKQALLQMFEKNIEKKFDLAVNYLTNIVKTDEYFLMHRIDTYLQTTLLTEKQKFSFTLDYKMQIKTKIRDLLKAKLNVKKLKTLNIYEKFLSYLKDKPEFACFAKNLQADIKDIKQKQVAFEDLAPLTFLKARVFETENFSNICHTAIDEAQDLPENAFFVLKYILKKSAFSVYGDMNQAIARQSAISNWNVLNDVFEHEFKQLNKTYRTTIEIMNYANSLTKFAPIMQGEPVIRNGEEVVKTSFGENYENVLMNLLTKQLDKHFKSYAIICKTQNECEKVCKILEKNGIDFTFVNGTSSEKLSKVNVLTVLDAKGLEFDRVIINDESMYNLKIEKEVKMLYVAVTRAIFELNILTKWNKFKLWITLC